MTDTKTITLNTPIKMGDNEITELTLTKPMIGQVRGVKIFDLLQGNTDAYIELLPRISTPAMNKAQASTMDLIDFLQVIEVVGEWFTSGKANTPTV